MFECQIKNLELKRNPPPMTAGPWTCILKKKISGIFRFQFSPTSLFFPLGVHVSNFKELSHGISLQLCTSRQNLNSICFVDRVHYYY
jgi:hypothetical protein